MTGLSRYERPSKASDFAFEMTEKLVEGVLSRMEDVTQPWEKALKLKDEANQFFKDEAYDTAIELYTKCIELDSTVSTFFCNRSLAYLRKELYGLALADADKAIELDQNYAKAYFRRASSNMALGKFKLALKDYDTARRLQPNNREAQKKYEECQKIVKRLAFEKAIACNHDAVSLAESINVDEIVVESSYAGPRLDGDITIDFMKELIQTFKNEKKLHTKYAYKILLSLRKYFMQQPSLVDITVPAKQKFTICGDIHGQFYDLCNIFELNGLPSPTNPYVTLDLLFSYIYEQLNYVHVQLFNGDFVDRGSFSVETIFTLFGFKLLYPDHFYMSRGNHESDVMNKMYGFEGEVKSKFNQKMAELFTEIFNYLPLCHVINKKVFACHGGLFKEEGVTLEKIAATHRFRQPPDDGIMCDLLWSDPQESLGKAPSKRGVGIQFGPDVTELFLKDNDLLYVVRSHEVKPEGYQRHHDGKCYTIFSAPNYCDTIGNKGAFITIHGDELYPPKITSFDAVPHPTVKAMAYASSLFNFLS